MKSLADATSLYHRIKQHDGRGYGIIKLDAIGSNGATVVAVNLTESEATKRLHALRGTEAKS